MGISYKVLEAIQNAGTTLNLKLLTRELGIERSALEGIIEFWVRKGKIIRINDTICSSSSCSRCPIPCPAKSNLPKGVTIYQASEES